MKKQICATFALSLALVAMAITASPASAQVAIGVGGRGVVVQVYPTYTAPINPYPFGVCGEDEFGNLIPCPPPAYIGLDYPYWVAPYWFGGVYYRGYYRGYPQNWDRRGFEGGYRGPAVGYRGPAFGGHGGPAFGGHGGPAFGGRGGNSGGRGARGH